MTVSRSSLAKPVVSPDNYSYPTNVDAAIDRLNSLLAEMSAKGDLLTMDGTNLVRKAAGVVGQYLTPQADGSLAWADLPAASSGVGSVAASTWTAPAQSTDNYYTLTVPGQMLITRLRVSVVGSDPNWKLQLYEDAARNILAYDSGFVLAAEWDDRIPLEWFGGTTIYARVQNASLSAVTQFAPTINYRL